MGMYTEIQGTIEFKNECLAQGFSGGNQWVTIGEMLPEIAKFYTSSRSDWIPHSGKGVYSIKGKIVKFHSELKNYDQTIEEFLKILPMLANKWCLETLYEEYSNWTLHRNNEEDVSVNGDNSFERECRGYHLPRHEFPNFDVFDLSNLK